MPPFEISFDKEAASRLVADGVDVVVVLGPGQALGPFPDGPGRVAVLVGDAADPADLEAAASMGAELFGPSATGLPPPRHPSDTAPPPV